MQLDVRRDFAGELGEAEVLDDERVHAGGGDLAELLLGGLHFAGEDEGVHRDEAFHAVAVEVFHELVEIRIDEIIRAQAGVEARQAEINRVGSGGDAGGHRQADAGARLGRAERTARQLGPRRGHASPVAPGRYGKT